MQKVIYLTINDTMLELISVTYPSSPSIEQWQVGYKMMAFEVTTWIRLSIISRAKELACLGGL